MDEFGLIVLLLALLFLAAPVMAIVALVQIGGLKTRIAALEEIARAAALRRQREREEARTSPANVPPPLQDIADTPDLAAETRLDERGYPVPIETLAAPEPAIAEPEPAMAEALPPAAPGWGAAFQRNWLVWVAAVSLALGGVFVVQYGIEQGLLGPTARVIGAALLGAGLIAAGERVRRLAATEHLRVFHPSVALAAGGIATLFAAAMAAHLLYGLVGPLPGFVAMAAVAGVAVLFGLIYGPVLAGVGLIGAYLTPALVAGGEPTPVLYGYILIVAVACYLVDRIRHWIWLSEAASALALFWAWGLSLSLGAEPGFGLFLVGLAVAVTTLPPYGLPLRSQETGGVMMAPLRRRLPYPALLANVTVLAAAVLALSRADLGALDAQVTLLALGAMIALAVLGQRRAPVFDTVVPGLLLVTLGWFAVASWVEGARGALPGPDWDLPAGEGPGSRGAVLPWAIWGAGLLALGSFAGGVWRVSSGTRPMLWALVAALGPIGAIVALWTFWRDLMTLSPAGWGIVAAAAALAPTLVCGWLRRLGDASTAPVLALGALGLLGLAAGLALSDAPLTIALAVLALAAVVLDRRFDLPLLTRGAEAAAVLIGTRYVIWPGLGWGLTAPLTQVALGYLAPALILGAASLRTRTASGRVVLETAAAAGLAIFLSLLGARGLAAGTAQTLESVALYTVVWGVLALVQLARARGTGELVLVRQGLAAVYGAIAALALVLALTALSPLAGGTVRGPWVIDSLAFAYLLPAGLLLAAWRGRLVPEPRLALGGGLALAAIYLTLEIRRLWRGDVLSVPGVSEPELYTYTLALLLAALVCILLGRGPGGADLRRAGLALAALTAAKVFLWDMAGLVGLARAGSFLALGLALAGIAWLHQRLDGRRGAE